MCSALQHDDFRGQSRFVICLTSSKMTKWFTLDSPLKKIFIFSQKKYSFLSPTCFMVYLYIGWYWFNFVLGMDSYAKGHCAGFRSNKNSFGNILKLLYMYLFGLWMSYNSCKMDISLGSVFRRVSTQWRWIHSSDAQGVDCAGCPIFYPWEYFILSLVQYLRMRWNQMNHYISLSISNF